MKTRLECIPCLVKQALHASHMADASEKTQWKIVRDVLAYLSEFDFDKAPAFAGNYIYRRVAKMTGVNDPFKKSKDYVNTILKEQMGRFEKILDSSEDRFATAVKLSLAGNIIDFVLKSERDIAIMDTINEVIDTELAIDHTDKLREAVGRARSVLVIGDNAGETFFDRLLLGEIPSERRIYGVKGGPVINDATREDAITAGIDDVAEIIDNGSLAPGTILGDCSRAFVRAFYDSDVVISKGQGNYETLDDADREVFFILRAKCNSVADNLNVDLGDLVVGVRHAPFGVGTTTKVGVPGI